MNATWLIRRGAIFCALGLAAVPAFGAALWEEETTRRLTFPHPSLVVNGLGWFREESPVLRRLPTRLQATFPPKVWTLAQIPAGVRVRFSTDSRRLAVVAESSGRPTSWHITQVAAAGLDIYIDGKYHGSAAPDRQGAVRHEWVLGTERRAREVTLYLPYGTPVVLQEILLEEGSRVADPSKFALPRPVVYYGSSITQGASASNPGLAYQAQLGRWLNLDFINLGFSGNGHGEPALAHAVAEIEAACFVVDYWANPPAAVYRETLPDFVDILRQRHPHTPIIVTGCYFNPSENVPGEAGQRQVEKRRIAREFVAARRAAGDLLVYHVEGFDLLSPDQADGLVDARHANSLGMYYYARGLEPVLREVLDLPSAGRSPRRAPR